MQAASSERRIDALLALPRSAKHALAVLVDSALCVLTVWLAICFRFESWVSLTDYQWLAVALSVLLAIPLLTAFGFYHTVIRYAGRQTIVAALRAVGIYAVIYSAIFTAYGFPLVPRTIGILQPLLLLIGLALVRLLASQLLNEHTQAIKVQDNLPVVLIYGAGNSGQQLATLLKAKGESRIIGFIDDNKNLHKARIAGIPVYDSSEVVSLTIEHKVSDVLLAMPSLTRNRRNDIIKLLRPSRVAVRTLPSLTDLAHGKVNEEDLRELNIEDLLGREPVKPDQELLTENITGKSILVTGAGGSIGSELCRQIIKLAPKQLVMIELNEFTLYKINDELSATANERGIKITPILANVLDEDAIDSVMLAYKPQTIYHAAAYKHVPLVESNPVVGLKNNVLGTLYLARNALKHDVQDFVLISTDKAVRPTNIMGASKRLAEVVLQGIANEYKDTSRSTRFSIVRFGNVLASSGSVVPKFREQILAGGPVTVTHPNITRYFMTIPEAAQLVLQASPLNISHTRGASIFILDMGEPVRIVDLAALMIQLAGHTIKNHKHENTGIDIEFIGLRPGEKLYEELLIDSHSEATEHSKIFRAVERFHPWLETERFLHTLRQTPCDGQAVLQGILQLDLGYQPPSSN